MHTKNHYHQFRDKISFSFSIISHLFKTFVAKATAALSGNRNSAFSASNCAHTNGGRNPTWWLVDLGLDVRISNVIITSRNEGSKDWYIYLQILSRSHIKKHYKNRKPGIVSSCKSLLAFIALLAAQSSVQTHIHNAIVFIDTSNNASHNQVHWLFGKPYLVIKASNVEDRKKTPPKRLLQKPPAIAVKTNSAEDLKFKNTLSHGPLYQ